MELLAVDPESPLQAEGFVRNFSVARVLDATTNPHDIAEELATDVARNGISEAVEQEVETFPVGDVAVIRYDWTVTLNSTADLALSQYGIAAGDIRFVLTFTSLASERADYAEVWTAVVDSFRIGR